MTPEFSALYTSPRWKDTRWRIILRDGGACTVCGAKQILAVHHERYIGSHPSDTPDEYLKTLCHHCHDKAHDIERKAHDFARIGDVITGLRHLFEETDEPEASRVVDCCLYLEEVLR